MDNLDFIPETMSLFKEKKKEVVDYIDFIKKISNSGTKIKYKASNLGITDIFEHMIYTRFMDLSSRMSFSYTEEPVSIQLIHTLKSSGVLLLYSLSESIASTLMREIHENLTKEFQENRLNIRKMHINLVERMLKHHKNMENVYESIGQHILKPRKNAIEKILFKQWLDFYKDKVEKENKSPWFSGNVDNKSITELGKSYGFYEEGRDQDLFTREQCSTLVRIKNGRNSLAHGKQSFVNYGADLSINELENFSTDIFEYIESLMELVNGYLKNKNYIRCR